MVDDLHSHFTGRYLPYGVWSERQLCGTHDGCTSTNRYSGYDLCAESAGSAQTATKINQHWFFGFQNFVLKRIVGYFFNTLIHFCSSFLLRLLVRNAREFLRLTPLLPFTSPRRQALLAQFFSRLQKLVAEPRAGHRLGQGEPAVHQDEQGDCLFAAFASSINHLSE